MLMKMQILRKLDNMLKTKKNERKLSFKINLKISS